MNDTFDIDAPADLELLGGTFDDTPAAIEPEAAAPAEPEAIEPEAADTNEPEPDEPPKRDAVIPRARFDDVNAKLHAQREENERLRAELDAKAAQSMPAASGSLDVDALEDAFFDAMIDGDKERAKVVRAQINAEIYRRAEEAGSATAVRALTEREASNTFAQSVQATVAAYPFLDSTAPDANQEAIAEVVEWRDFYISKGQDAASALQAAAKKVAPMYVDADPVTAPLVDPRKQAAAAVGAKVAAAQPPRVDAGVGNRAIPAGDEIVGNQDKWEKASDAERLRYLS